MKYKTINDEVLYTTENITKINKSDIDQLKILSRSNPRKRIRICTHPDIGDNIHEMIIIHASGAYITPHKHIGKSESFHIIEGVLLVVIFDEKGGIIEQIRMGDSESGLTFYYRLPANYFHTVVPQSELVVFHEVTNGPFVPEDTVFAPWAPSEEDDTKQKQVFQNKLL
jgi:cupin fold WbuC family metalloprotein